MSLGIEMILSSGRCVRLEQLHVLPTQTSFTESGHRFTMEDWILGTKTKLFGQDIPHVVLHGDMWIHQQFCLCLFGSLPMQPRGVTLENSLLVVCWFAKTVDLPLRQLLCEGLSGLDWEAHAKDFHSEW